MTETGYRQFCPIAMAAEVLCSRWTLLVLRELCCGSVRFNELRRGLARMSPALLSKRLKDLEAKGIIMRTRTKSAPNIFEYKLTTAGEDLRPLIFAIGEWGQRWIETSASLSNLDAELLMWDIRRNIDPKPMPRKKSTIEFIFGDLPKNKRRYWLMAEPGQEVDLCSVDPGFDVDLYLSTDLKTLTEVWMGYTNIARAKRDGRLTVAGSKQLEASLATWLSLSKFAKVDKLVA